MATPAGRPRSPWHEAAPVRPTLDRNRKCDAAVIGGGMAGISSALELTAAGASVVVLEAKELASGVSGNTSAKLSALHGLAYSRIAEQIGPEAAVAYADLNLAGVDRVRRITEERGIECDFATRPAVTFTESPRRVRALEAEFEATRAAGLEVELGSDTELPFAVESAITLTGQARFDPVAWIRAVAETLEEEGARIYERTRVTELRHGAPCRIGTESGHEVVAGHVIVATHHPIFDRGLFFARLDNDRSHVVAGVVNGERPRGMYLSVDDPTRSIRSFGPDEAPQGAILVAGEGHRVGTGDEIGHYRALEEYLRERFDLHRITHHWSAHDEMSPDRLPFIGPILPRMQRILVTTGYSKWGLAASAGAAAILSDHVQGRPSELTGALDPGRLNLRASLRPVLAHNAASGMRFFAERITKRLAPKRELRPGEGQVVNEGFGQVAVSVDDDGLERRVSARCTHLGCIVGWNDADKSWDCPCHGSRFGPDGSVIHGPAVHPLEPRS